MDWLDSGSFLTDKLWVKEDQQTTQQHTCGGECRENSIGNADVEINCSDHEQGHHSRRGFDQGREF